ncbi:hypothetical protein BGX24_004030 [Mortierella sp. AD032]|nr:hypothetical protein BGX24_004030 [Mortierella sp. AD032]
MTTHLLALDAPEHFPALADSNEKDLTDYGGADTPSSFSPASLPQAPHPLITTTATEAATIESDIVVVISSESQLDAPTPDGRYCQLCLVDRKDEVKTRLNPKQETDLDIGLLKLSLDTRDRRSMRSIGYESDAESFAAASFFRSDTEDINPTEAEAKTGARCESGDASRTRSCRTRFQDEHVDDEKGGRAIFDAHPSLGDNNIKNHSTGQALLGLDDSTGVKGRGEQSMQGCHISGSDSVMMVAEVEIKADDAPQYQSGDCGFDCKDDKADVLEKEVKRSKDSKGARTTSDPQSSLALAPAPPMTPISIMRPISCECGRVIDSPVIPTAAAAVYFQDPRHQRRFACDQPGVTLDQASQTPLPAPRSPLSSSYFVPMSSFLPSSYQASLSSWCDSFIAPSYASLLSSHIHFPNDDNEDDDDDGQESFVHERTAIAAAAQGNSTVPTDRRFHGPGHGFNNIGNHGVAAAGRLVGLVMSTGQATLSYVTSTVVPSAIHIAHRSASSTIGFLTSHIPRPNAVPSVLPRFLGEALFNRQAADGTNHSGVGVSGGGGNGREHRYPGNEVVPGRRSRSTPDGRGLGDRMTRSSPNFTNPSSTRRTRELSLPDMAHHRSRRSADPSSPSLLASKRAGPPFKPFQVLKDWIQRRVDFLKRKD